MENLLISFDIDNQLQSLLALRHKNVEHLPYFMCDPVCLFTNKNNDDNIRAILRFSLGLDF